MSAASQAKRIAGDAVEIVAFERGTYSSFAACGIPYWIAGDVDDPERLIARSPDAHRRNGIDLHMRTEVQEIDLHRAIDADPLDPRQPPILPGREAGHHRSPGGRRGTVR